MSRPSQHETPIAVPVTNHRRLCRAILQSVYDDVARLNGIRIGAIKAQYADKRLESELEDFLTAAPSPYLFSFYAVCEALDLDWRATRRQLREIMGSERAA